MPETLNIGMGASQEQIDAQKQKDIESAAKGATVRTVVADLTANSGTGSIQVTEAVAPRPESVPEKFWDAATGQIRVDDLVRSYSELEKKIGTPQSSQDQAQTKAQQSTDQTQSQHPDDPVAQASREFSEKGALSEGTYQALAAKGLDKSTVDAYISGQKAQVALLETKAFEVTGGKDAYTDMSKWAVSALNDAELTAYNADVADPAKVATAVAGLYARFKATGNYEPRTLQRGSTEAVSVERFRSRHEMQTAMNDPRYKAGDKAFHADVQRKMRNSMDAGINLFS